jgi:hypothetical protein
MPKPIPRRRWKVTLDRRKLVIGGAVVLARSEQAGGLAQAMGDGGRT